MLKGIFKRKDNGKDLTTTRIVQGDELIQARQSSYKRIKIDIIHSEI